jgi:hypothetical protein
MIEHGATLPAASEYIIGPIGDALSMIFGE